MDRRFALAALASLSVLAALPATPAHAAGKPRYTSYPKGPKPRAPAPAPRPEPLGDTVRVEITTEYGVIPLDLDHKRTPVTVGNFVRYVDLKRFDGIVFYRAMRLPWGDQPNGLIQGGLQGHPLKVLKPIAHEPTSQTGILHKAGAISMARHAPGTAMADFSILLSDLPSLDADPAATDPDQQAGFAAFGHVTGDGMAVVRRIWDAPLSPTLGEGPLKGQMLAPPIKVLTVRRGSLATPPSPPQP